MSLTNNLLRQNRNYHIDIGTLVTLQSCEMVVNFWSSNRTLILCVICSWACSWLCSLLCLPIAYSSGKALFDKRLQNDSLEKPISKTDKCLYSRSMCAPPLERVLRTLCSNSKSSRKTIVLNQINSISPQAAEPVPHGVGMYLTKAGASYGE